jgi:nitrate/nitrite transport system substrate-binding protein
LSSGRYVNAPVDVLKQSLTGTVQFSSGEAPRSASDFNVFHRYAANFPWRSHAVWFLSQMLRWGQIDHAVQFDLVAKAVYRPEIYRRAAEELGILTPEVDFKLEGIHDDQWALMCGGDTLTMGPDRFMDGRRFDASKAIDYLSGFEVSHTRVNEQVLAAANGIGPGTVVDQAS